MEVAEWAHGPPRSPWSGSGTYSTPMGRPFHGKLDGGSTAQWTVSVEYAVAP